MDVAEREYQESNHSEKETYAHECKNRIALPDKKLIGSTTGVIYPATEGIITYEVENLGRQLIAVKWNDGLVTCVFPDEIEIADDDSTPALH